MDIERLKVRLKSFAWRLGGMVLVAVISWVVSPEMAEILQLPAIITVIGGLVVNEITKELNK